MTHNLLANYMAYDNPFLKSSTFYIPLESKDIDEALKSKPDTTLDKLDAQSKQLSDIQKELEDLINGIRLLGSILARHARNAPESDVAQNVISGAVFALLQDVNSGKTIDNNTKFQSLANYYLARGMNDLDAYSYAQASLELSANPGRWTTTLDNALLQTLFDYGKRQENSAPVIGAPPTQQDVSVGSGLNSTPEGVASSLAQINAPQLERAVSEPTGVDASFIPALDYLLEPSEVMDTSNAISPDFLVGDQQTHSIPGDDMVYLDPSKYTPEVLNRNTPLSYPDSRSEFDTPKMTFNDFLNGTSGPLSLANSLGYSDSSLLNYLNGDNTSLSVPLNIINELAVKLDLSGVGNTDTGSDFTSPGDNVSLGTLNASALQNILNSGKLQASNLWNNIKGNPVPWAIGGAAGLAGLAGLAKLTGMWPFDSEEEEDAEQE